MATWYINGQDALSTWGVSFDDTALSTLMTPAPIKSFIENKSRLSDGKQVLLRDDYARTDERTITLGMFMRASSESAFLRNYDKFCKEVLALGKFDISTDFQPDVVYHCIYLSCQQFSESGRSLAKFSLRLCEPNPADRTDHE